MNWNAINALNSSLILNELENLPEALEEKAYEREAIADYEKEILDKKERIWSMQNPLEERLLMQIAKQIREASSKNTIENFEALCKVTAQDQYN